jgi:hypothetical protein
VWLLIKLSQLEAAWRKRKDEENRGQLVRGGNGGGVEVVGNGC